MQLDIHLTNSKTSIFHVLLVYQINTNTYECYLVLYEPPLSQNPSLHDLKYTQVETIL